MQSNKDNTEHLNKTENWTIIDQGSFAVCCMEVGLRKKINNIHPKPDRLFSSIPPPLDRPICHVEKCSPIGCTEPTPLI